MRGSRATRARRRSTGSAHPGFGDWTMERRIELALAVERAARERDPLVTNVEDTVYSDTEARAALANSNGFCDSFEETQCYAFAYAFAGDGADRMTGMGFAVGRGPDELDPEQVGREAADRALALHGARQPESRRCPVVLDPHVAASFASIIGAHAVGGRRPAGPLAVRRARGRADRGAGLPARRRRPAPRGPRDRAVRRRRRGPADHAADRGRRAAHLPVRHLHGQQGGARLDRQRRARLVPDAARRWPPSNLRVAAGRRQRRDLLKAGRRRPLRDGRGGAALRREPGFRQLLRGRHRAASSGTASWPSRPAR